MTGTSTQLRGAPGRFERPERPPAGPGDPRRDIGPTYVANAVIGLVFSATGPLAVILASGAAGDLSPAQLSSWIFAVFFLNGALTVGASLVYRQPLGFFWTIPGTVLVGKSLGHLPWSDVLGAFLVTALLVLALGLSGLVGRAMRLLPMPIVMAMVAGVFLRFGLDLVSSIQRSPWVAVPMVVVFVLLSVPSRFTRLLPPVLGSLLVGVVAVLATDGLRSPIELGLAGPLLQAPTFSAPALAELVVSLAITVIVVQNGQGAAVLTAAGHRPPVNVATVLCGLWSLPAAALGAVSTCLTGPTNALLVASGERRRQYTAAVACGALAMVVGVLAPTLVSFMLAMPPAWIAVLGGVAMLKALQTAFCTAFSGGCAFGALVAFLVTVADLTVLGIGGAFWGVVAGYLVTRLLEPADLLAATGG
ncbi:benzoate/H(+) symporter BenE family transporter [Agilicoccus flavus]|uniref:benzoate/H(+) symporter BenE family transporter n=1 Tax=Agilicoccus flavus TaxID=2775968 RepID=UPI001CF695CD|nr:benzoate/H(+) symporter BenE family transporter [Agilicoccus flavus]